MAIRLSGLVSGMDTEAMVKELVKAYSTKKDNLVKAQTKLQWKQDAWKELNTKILAFYKKSLSDMRFSSAYTKKTTTVSDPAKASVVASENAVTGSQTLAVKKLARAAYLTGGQLSSNAKGNTKLSDLGISVPATISLTAGGNTTDIELTGDMTLDKLAKKMSASGVQASYDSENHRFFVQAKNSGTAGDFSITAGSVSGLQALSDLGLYSAADSADGEYARWAGYVVKDASGAVDEAATKANLASTINDTVYGRAQAMLEENDSLTARNAQIQEAIDSMNEALNGSPASGSEPGAPGLLNDENYLAYKDRYTEDELNTRLGYTGENAAEAGLHSFNEKLAAVLRKDAAAEDALIQNPPGTWTPDDIEAHTQEAEKLRSAAGVTEVIDNYQSGIQQNTQTLTNNQNKIDANNALMAGGNAQLTANVTDELYNKAVLADQVISGTAGITPSSSAVKLNGQDAEIILNGAEYSSSTNTFSINGLTINAKEITGKINDALPDSDINNWKTISINTDKDYEGVYNTIKDFFKEYNTLIKEMDSLYNASSAKGYEPLTTEEKEAMGDKEIEQWEKKIKDALLRRDGTLDSVTNLMKQAMSKGFEVNGKTYTLGSFGINTQEYFLSGDNEKGVYHIDGDADDAVTSGKDDKLKAAIASDPDTVMSFFQQITTNLYNELNKKMQSTSMNSFEVIYNDKKMQQDYDDYKDEIKSWEKKLKDMEDKYYKQFSAMETALARMQSSTSAITSLLGGA